MSLFLQFVFFLFNFFDYILFFLTPGVLDFILLFFVTPGFLDFILLFCVILHGKKYIRSHVFFCI